MKAFLRLLGGVICALAVLSSCVKAPFLTLNGSKSIMFTDEGGSQSITFSCNRAWTVSASEKWIRVSPSSGEASDGNIPVSIACEKNSTYDPREATITITTEGLTETIYITQATNLGLYVGRKSFDLTKEEQSIEFEVSSNVDYTVAIDPSCKGWVSQINTKGLSSTKLAFSIAANSTYEERSGTIAIKQNGGDLSEIISIKQDCVSYLDVEINEYSVSFEGNTIEIPYKSNFDVECSVSAPWLSVVSTKAVTNGTVSVQVNQNINFNNRTATLTIKCRDVQKEIVFNQSPNDASSQPDDEIWYTATKQIVPERYDVFGPKYLHEKSSYDSETGFGIIKCAHPVERIGDGAFASGCEGLISVSIPSQVTSIGDIAFYNCNEMRSIAIPDNVTSVAPRAFYVCRNLEAFYGRLASSDHRALVIDGTLVSFAPGGLTHYSIPEGVTALAGHVFNYMYDLKTVSFPTTLKTIGSYCFEGSALESVTIPSTIEEIGESTFLHCHALTKVTFDGNNLKRLGDCAFSYSGIKELIYPDGLEYIGSNVLSGCYDLEYIYFPESIVSIKGGTCNSFNISRLEGKFVTDDGKCQIFEGVMVCFAAKDIESYSVPEGVISTGICFCENPIIKKIEFPSTIQKFYNFGFSNCPSLTEVYFRAKTPPTLEWDAFDGTCTHCTVYVPAGCEEDYKQAYAYNRFSGGIHGYDFE